MVATLLLQHEPTLVTAGDAISSWLQYPDKVTANRCMQSTETAFQKATSGSLLTYDTVGIDGWSPAICCRSKLRRWHQAINRRRWAIVLLLCLTGLGAAGVLLGVAVHCGCWHLHHVAGGLQQSLATLPRQLSPGDFPRPWG